VNFYKFILSVLFVTLLCADNQTAANILLQTFHRMDGINYRLLIDSKSSGKKKKEKHFEVAVYWPTDGKLLYKTRITSIKTKRKKPSSYWEHRFRNGRKAIKWISLPVTGKLKDVTDKKAGKKDFSLAELVVTEAEIRSHSHQLLPREKIDTLSVYVIESIMKSKKGKVKETKKLWIDTVSYMIMKVEFYTGSGRLYRSVECSNFHYFDELLFPMSIYIQDRKSKTDIEITLKDIELNPEFEMDIFIPKDQ